MSIPSHQAALSAARRLFRQKGVVPEHVLAEPILRSWRRCAASGQDMRGARLPELLTQTELRQELDRHAALRRLCTPVMAEMKQRARAAGGLVVLTDAAGLVLDSGGSGDFLDRASQLALAPGASWSEAAAGTNAIGTALIERRPIVVQGAEHYFEPHRVLTCAAMPILDPAGRTLGLLDLTCHADGRWRDAGDSLRAAIDLVESTLFEDLAASCLMLRLHTRADGLEQDTAALLAFDGDTLAAANRHALALLGIDRAGMGVFRYEDLFAGTPGQAAASGRLHRQNGQMLHAQVRWPDQGIVARPGAINPIGGAGHVPSGGHEHTTPAIGNGPSAGSEHTTGGIGNTLPVRPERHGVLERSFARAERMQLDACEPTARDANAGFAAPAPDLVPAQGLPPPTTLTRDRRARHRRTQDEQRPAVPSQSYWFDTATLGELARTVRLLDAGVAVLLQGETGVGKEIFARQMHQRSERAAGPFVAVNCAALPETLIESELFGYEDGAFTGARKQGSKGLLRQAQGGVLFLDEIGDMPLALQARLLRVLQAREVTPLGGGRAVPVDFALICATHQALDIGLDGGTLGAVAGGCSPVRSDLYFRIAEYTVRLPALREYADRAAIVRALWDTRCGAVGDAPSLPTEVLRLLTDYAWPGNFRQLSTTLRTLLVLAGDEEVRVDMLSADIRGAMPSLAEEAAAGTLQGLTDLAIRGALQACDGNVSQAARRLGVHRSTLYRRVKGGAA